MLSEEKVRALQNKILMAEKRREVFFTRWSEHYHRLYSGQDLPLHSGINDENYININLSHANVEIEKPAVFLRNPKTFITNRQKFVDTGKKDKATNELIILDGYKMSQTLQSAINPLAHEINLKDEMAKCRDDGLIGSYWVMMTGYNTEFGIDEEENEFIKDQEIYVRRIDPNMFGVDPELNEFDLSKAKFVYRTLVLPLDEVKDNPNYSNTKDLQGTDIGFGDSIDSKKRLLDFTSTDFQQSDDVKRVVLYEVWQKPTPSEKRKGKKGQIIVLAKNHPKSLREDDWALDIDGYPFEIGTFNRMNDRFYPPFDLSFYEAQLNEKNKLRTYQLQNAKTIGNMKVLYDADALNEEEVQKILEGDNIMVGIKGLGDNPIASKVMVVTPGSVSAEFYTVDQKVDRDVEFLSQIPDVKRGIQSAGDQTATEAQIETSSANVQTRMRLDIMSDFYIRIVRKIIQLMKQFYDIEKMAEITGTNEVEWTNQGFSKTSIKNEFDVQIDVASMIPKNEAVDRRQALDISDRVARIIESPALMAKLLQEGTTINFTETLQEIAKKFDIKNDKILEALNEQAQAKMLGFLAMIRGNKPAKDVTGGEGVPSEANIASTANNPTPGPLGALGV